MKKYSLYLTAVLVGIFLLLGDRDIGKLDPSYDEMIQAKNKMITLTRAIYNEKLNRGITVDKKIDTMETGLLGEEFTGITTTLGDLDSKRISTNPDFAAYFVKEFKRMKLVKGDVVYVNMSSSFPGLNLSLISALDVLELKGVIINSVGASMYGANNEEFTFLEMVEFLKSRDMIENTIEMYSLGGDGDSGLNFDEEIRERLIKRLDDINIEMLKFENLTDNIEKRINYYSQFSNPKYFINIGGNLVASKLEKHYKNEGIPVLVMLNIKQIALANGISNETKIEKLYTQKYKLKYYIAIIVMFIVYILYSLRVENKKNNQTIK